MSSPMNDAEPTPPTTALAEAGPMSLLRLAVEKGAGADELEKLAALAERLEANRAKAAFAQAMNECQKEMPVVVRDAQNKRVSTERKTYVKLESLQATVRPIYTKHGFSVSWSQGEAPREGLTRVLARLYHIGGHSEGYQGDYPLDGEGAKGAAIMNPLQGTVSSHTYAQRDMLRLMFSITIVDKDFDGNRGPAPSEGILADQVDELNALVAAHDSKPGPKVSLKLLCEYASEAGKRPVVKLEEFDQNQFLIIKADLLRKIKAREAKK